MLKKICLNIKKKSLFIIKTKFSKPFTSDVKLYENIDINREQEEEIRQKNFYFEYKQFINSNKQSKNKFSENEIEELMNKKKEIPNKYFSNLDIEEFVEIASSNLFNNSKPLKVITIIEILKIFYEFKINHEELMIRCESLIISRKNEVKELSKENLIIIYKLFSLLNRKNYIFWEEIDNLINLHSENLTFDEKLNILESFSFRLNNEDNFNQYKNTILIKKVNTILENFMIKKLTNQQYLTLLRSLVLQQLNCNANNTLILDTLFNFFPTILKKMSYNFGVDSTIFFLKSNFILPESEFMNEFVSFIIKKEPKIYIDIEMKLFWLGLDYYQKTEWSENLILNVMDRLGIKRKLELFLEDINLFSKYYKDQPDKLSDFIFESSALCRVNNIRNAHMTNINEKVKEESDFYKYLDLKELDGIHFKEISYNKI